MMIRARYGRLWTLAAAAILLVVFFTSIRSRAPTRSDDSSSWSLSKQHPDAFQNEDSAAILAGDPPLAQASSSAVPSASAVAGFTPVFDLKEPDEEVLEPPEAEIAADSDRDALQEHKDAAADLAAGIVGGASNTLDTPSDNLAADVDDEIMDDYGNTVEDPEKDVDTWTIEQATSTASEAAEPTPLYAPAQAEASPSPSSSNTPEKSGSPSNTDLDKVNLGQPDVQPSQSETPADEVLPSTVADAAVVVQTSPSTPETDLKAAKVKRSKTVVVGRMQEEDTSWIARDLPDWQNAIYYVDLDADTPSPSGLRTRMNKAREAMPYLTYIIDHYSDLPDIMAFIHPHKKSWHNDVAHNSAVDMLDNLRLAAVQERGYVNLRCNGEVGCPDEIQPFRTPVVEEKLAERAFIHVYGLFFHATEVEMRQRISVVATQCCAQFAVTREEVLKRPVEDYIHYREYLEQTHYDDATIGRVMEYMWHMIFHREPVHCEDVFECWCAVYSRCYASELDKSWSGWLGLTKHPDVEPEDVGKGAK